MTMNVKNMIWCVALFAGMLAACKKDKSDNVNNNNLNLIKSSNTNIRLFNFTDYDVDMTINNIPLTAYGKKDGNNILLPGTGNVTQLGLQYFPKEAWKAAEGGSPFTLPTTLLDKNGRADINLLVGGLNIDTVLQNNTLQPMDYYLFRRLINNVDSFYFVTLQRESNPPAIAERFKIRILNFGGQEDPLGMYGPVTLTYADGRPVSDKLSNIAPNTASPYIELPYGAYQFKLFMSDGSSIDITKQFTQAPVQPDYQSTLPLPQPQEGVVVPVRSYKPGAAYTLLLNPAGMKYNSKYTGNDVTTDAYNMNVYRLVTDIAPGVNYAFARVQAANAIPGATLNVTVDGTPVSQGLAFGKSDAYKVLTRGDHMVAISDAGGKELARKTLTLYPYDNYTIWAVQKADGSADIAFAAINMTSSQFEPNANLTGYDGSAGVKTVPYACSVRFLNLSPDLPLLTFTNDYSLMMTLDYFKNMPFAAACNLASGVVPDVEPFLNYSIGKRTLGLSNPANVGFGELTKLRAYESSTGKYPDLPGKLRADIEPLSVREAFIANKAIYTDPSYMPWGEVGVYTVALIGKVTPGAGAGEKARIMVIKHNQ